MSLVDVETRLALDKNDRVTLNASGTGTIEFRAGVNERWKITLLNTTGNSTVQPKCKVVRTSNGRQLDYTVTGNGDASNTDIEIRQGDGIRAEYTSGTSGAVMEFHVEGDLFVKGRRGY